MSDVLKKAYAKFGDSQVTVDEMATFASAENVDAPDLGDYDDYAFQVKCDAIFEVLQPKLALALSEIKYVSTNKDEKELKALRDHNSDVVIKIAKLIEEHDLPVSMVDNVASECGQLFSGLLRSAVVVVDSRCQEAVQNIACEKLGVRRLSVGVISEHITEVFEAAAAKNGEKKG